MLIIGITGGSGCGKSSVCQFLKEKGLYHIDCDKVSRLVTAPGSKCLEELTEFFGKEILCEDNSLNRRMLGSIAFSSKDKTEKLNEITLKYIIDYLKSMLKELENRGERAALLDGATLIESGLNKICNYNIAVCAPKNKRIELIVNRDGLSYEEAQKRIDAQKCDDFYSKYADYIIINESTLEDLKKHTNDVYTQISKREDWNEA